MSTFSSPVPPLPPVPPSVARGGAGGTIGLLSIIVGVLSIPLAFVCVGVVTAPIAIVLGLIGYFASTPRNRRGLIGAGLGVVALAIFVVMLVLVGNVKESPAQARMSSAASRILTDDAATWSGNTPQAEALAKQYSDAITRIDAEFFEWKGGDGKAPKVSLSGGKFVTYCFLKDDSCVFLVHVPAYRKYEAEAKKAVATSSWAAAQLVAREAGMKDNAKLGVGLKGAVLYGSVMTGTVGASNGADHESTNKDDLVPFFELPEDAK